MRFLIRGWSVRLGCILLAVTLLSGCAAGRAAFKDGEKALSQESYDQAIYSFMAAVKKEPKNYEYRLKLNSAREKSAQNHKHWGDKFFEQSNYRKAQEEYRLAADLDGSYYVAAEGLQNSMKYLQAQKLTADAEELLSARRQQQAKVTLEQALSFVNDFQPALQLRQKLEQNNFVVVDGVELEVVSTQPITLNFTDAKLPDVFEILTNLSGINFILDEDVRGSNTTLFLEQATFAQALELLLRMNKLDKKILNSKTIILFPKTRDKQKQFEDQLIQTFYLSNIDAKKAVNLLRTMLQVRKIYVHEELNAIIIRDTPAVIKLAQKVIEANDRGDSEVVFDLELIEIEHSDDSSFGLRTSANIVQAGLAADGALAIAAAGVGATDPVSGLLSSFDNLNPFYGIPTATFDMVKTLNNTETLASPKIRVKNKEKAKVHIGAREPVVTVTINGDQTSENVQYVDVGVKLDVEPVIQLDNTITTKLGLEVSNATAGPPTENGTTVLTISTTNANTTLTLKDGEQTIIGGLLRDVDSVSKSKIPFLSDIPLLGRLFTGTTKNKIKREILLSITPHIVKSVTLPGHDVSSIWSGGEDDLKYGRNFGTFADDYVGGQKGIEPQADLQVPTDVVPEPETAPLVDPATEKEPVPETSAQVPSALAPDVGERSESAPVVTPMTTPEEEAVAEQAILADAAPVAVVKPMVFIKGAELVKVGEPFSLTFHVGEIKDLFSAPMYVQYDKEVFEFISATEGDFLKQGVSPTIFTHTALEGSGRIIVGLKQGAGGKGLSGGGDLFIMNFKALAVGTGVIEPTRTNFRNPRGVRLKVETDGLTIEAQK